MQMKKKGKEARRAWARGYQKCRATKDHYGDLMLELAAEDPVLYYNFTSMSETIFNEVVDRGRPYISNLATKLLIFQSSIAIFMLTALLNLLIVSLPSSHGLAVHVFLHKVPPILSKPLMQE